MKKLIERYTEEEYSLEELTKLWMQKTREARGKNYLVELISQKPVFEDGKIVDVTTDFPAELNIYEYAPKAVKEFEFPSFDDWVADFHDFTASIGDFTCRIAKVGWGVNDNTKDSFMAGISVFNNPLNTYSPKIWESSIECERGDMHSLRYWYDRATENANREFAKYITGSYLDIEEV